MEESQVRLAQQGDAHAFRQLVERHAVVALRTARVLLRDPGAAEDALQEAWLDAWRGLASFQSERPFRPWLLTIVANRCRMVARRRVLPAFSLSVTDTDLLVDLGDPAEAFLRREHDEELRVALAALSEEQRRIIELRFFAELDLAEIADVLEVPLGTVKSRLHRALLALRGYLQRHTAAAVGSEMER